MQNYTSIGKNEISESLKDLMNFFKRILIYIIGSIQRFFLLFLLILFLIIALGYYNSKDSPSYYSSKMVCSFNHLHKKIYGEMIYNLNILAAHQSYTALAEKLNIPEATAAKIVRIEAKNIAGSPLHEDITEQQLPLYFTAVVTDRTVFQELEPAIVNYLNTQIPYHQKRMKLEMQRYSEKIDFLNTTLQQIDSAIYTFIANMQAGNVEDDSTSSLFGIANLIRLKEDLKNKKLSDQKMMQLQMAIEIVYGFSPTEHPNIHTGHSLKKIILLALFLAITIAVLLNLIWPKRKIA